MHLIEEKDDRFCLEPERPLSTYPHKMAAVDFECEKCALKMLTEFGARVIPRPGTGVLWEEDGKPQIIEWLDTPDTWTEKHNG